MEQEVISVALCTYNGSKYINEQLQSILNQTIKVDEIIIVDDGSTDRTEEIITSLISHHPQIKLYKNDKSLGVIKNFEKAINLCNGDYIALSDQDDIWLPEKLETMMKVITTNNSGMAFCDLTVVDQTLNTLHPSFWVSSGLRIGHPDSYISQLITQNFVTGCACMFTQDIKNFALPFPNNIPMHDHWLALVAAVQNKLYRVPEQLILYRQHGLNVVGSVQYSRKELLKKILYFWKIDFTKHSFHYVQKLEMVEALAKRLSDIKLQEDLLHKVNALKIGGIYAIYISLKNKIFPRPILRSILFQFYLIRIRFIRNPN